jgi:hypothetical protein
MTKLIVAFLVVFVLLVGVGFVFKPQAPANQVRYVTASKPVAVEQAAATYPTDEEVSEAACQKRAGWGDNLAECRVYLRTLRVSSEAAWYRTVRCTQAKSTWADMTICTQQ